MKFSLNTERAAILFIHGIHNFTYEQPGPIEVNPATLTEGQIHQLKSALLRDVLTSDETAEFLTQGVPVTPVVIDSNPIDPAEPVDSRREQLGQILRGSVSSVKKILPSVAMADVRKVRELEKEGKNRKSLLGVLDELLSLYTETVKESVGITDLADLSRLKKKETPANTAHLRGGLSLHQYMQNITDVVESDIEEIQIKTTDDEE